LFESCSNIIAENYYLDKKIREGEVRMEKHYIIARLLTRISKFL
jgi:hypothetical protein